MDLKLSLLSTGNHDWVGSDFVSNAGVGLVVKMTDGTEDATDSSEDGGMTILEQVKAVFERDWRSSYARSLYGGKDQQGKHGNLQQETKHMETEEENEWNDILYL